MFRCFLLTGDGNVFYSNGKLLKKRRQLISNLVHQQQQINSKINSNTNSNNCTVNTLRVNSTSYLEGNVGIGMPADIKTGDLSNILNVSGNVCIQGNCNIIGSLVLPNNTDQFQIFSNLAFFNGHVGIGMMPDTDSSYKLSVNGDALVCGNVEVYGNVNMKQGSGITFTDPNGAQHTQISAANTFTTFSTNQIISNDIKNPTFFDYFFKNELYGYFQVFIEPYSWTDSSGNVNLYDIGRDRLIGQICSFNLLSGSNGQVVSNLSGDVINSKVYFTVSSIEITADPGFFVYNINGGCIKYYMSYLRLS